MKNNIDYIAICKNLRNYREANKLTQKQVADATDIDRSTYAYYELGKTMPGFDAMDKLIRVFNITYDELFTSFDPKSSVNGSDECKPKDDDCELRLTKLERSMVLRVRMLSSAQQMAVLDSLGGEV